MKVARWNPFRLRNLALAALAIGIIAGLWLGDLFNGFGGGNSVGVGFTDSSTTKSQDRTDLVGYAKPAGQSTASTAGLVRILIDDRHYYLCLEDEDQPIELKSLVELVKSTPPNDDGLRAIVDRTAASRASAEHKLSEALKAAGIPEKAVYLKPAGRE